MIGGAISPPGNQLYLTQGFPGGSFDIKAVGTNAAQHLSVAGTDYYTLLFFGNTSGAGSLLTTSCHNLVGSGPLLVICRSGIFCVLRG